MTVLLVTNPLSDEGFSSAAQTALDASVKSPADLADRLRERFPLVAVRPSTIEGNGERWYVYRDGHWTAP